MRWNSQNSVSALKSTSPTLTHPIPKKKSHKTYKQAYTHFQKGSRCSIKSESYKNPKFFKISFVGPIADIPSLKNQKVQGTNVLRGESKAKLAIMTDLVYRACEFKVPQYDPKLAVFCVVLCAYRKNTFDEDNVATTIKDWLEPKFMRNKNRGWGIGVVPNDRMIRIYAVKKTKDSPNSHITEIVLRPYSTMKDAEENFLREILKPD